MSNEDYSTTGSHGPDDRPEARSWLSRLKALFGIKPPVTLRAEIEDALTSDADTASAEFSPEERAMLKNILTLREQTVDDVMVPRPDITAVSGEIPLSEVLLRFEEAEHSRLPVFVETIDDLKGMVHIKDVLRYLTTRARHSGGLDLSRADLSITAIEANLVREVLYVPPSMGVNVLLAKMQATHIHMALVIDEYGGTDGLVTIEDLIEMVVGDIEDEHDEVEGPTVIRGRDGSLVAQGRTSLEDIDEALGTQLDEAEVSEEVDTIGGLVATIAGRVPVRGEIIPGPSELDFEVLDADPRRVKRVRIRQRPLVQAEVAKAPIKADSA